ncbi:MAG: Ig-like domain-containing protein [Lachnospiraceae bacterium]|jgi:serine/threonine protein kinase|nr:Ig-like domain-containing protein [Lachnospiraceae bacterium]
MKCKGKGGLLYELATKPIATGGEGEIFDVIGQSKLIAKIYLPGKTSLEKEKKLVRMVDFPPDKSVLSQIAWPQDVLYESGQFVGFIMPKMDISEDLNVIYEYGSSAKYPHMTWENRIIIAENLCAVLDSVHNAGHICGDFNPKNISVNPNTGHICFLDTDSYHIKDGNDTYRCDVGIPEYLPGEIQVKMRGGSTLATAKLPTFSQDTDGFALSIHIFQLLINGVHPFACAIIPSQSSVVAPQPSDNIIKGEFPFMQSFPNIKIPAYAPEISILPKEIQDLFEQAFIDGHFSPSSRPTPVDWHHALRNLRNELKNCKNVSYHQYYKMLSACPWCEVDNRFSQLFRPKSSLTQTTIKPPGSTPRPSVMTPVSNQKSALLLKSTNRSNKPIIAVAIAIIVIVAGFFALRSIMPGGNHNDPIANILSDAITTPSVDVDLESSNKAYQNGLQAMANRNYMLAIDELRKVINRDDDYLNAQSKLDESIELYRNDILTSISELEAKEAYGEIINRLNLALSLIPVDNEFLSLLTQYTEIMYTKDKEYVMTRISEINTNTEESNDYDNGITELKDLLKGYPVFEQEINLEIAKFMSVLLSIFEVTLDVNSLNLAIGESEQLKYNTNIEGVKNVSLVWRSNNTSIATVDNNGKVEAKVAGKTTIILSLEDGTEMAVCDVSAYLGLNESFTSGTPLRNWSSSGKLEFDGSNGLLVEKGYLALNIMPKGYSDFIVEFEVKQRGNYRSKLVTICLGTNADNEFGDAFGIASTDHLGLRFDPHIKYAKAFGSRDLQFELYRNGTTISKAPISIFNTELEDFTTVKIYVKDKIADVYINNVYMVSQELSANQSAVVFYSGIESDGFFIRNFNITIEQL